MQYRTAQKNGFAGNVSEEKNLNNTEANFAQASALYRSAFTQLTDTNAYLQQHATNMSSNNYELQQKKIVATKPNEHDKSCSKLSYPTWPNTTHTHNRTTSIVSTVSATPTTSLSTSTNAACIAATGSITKTLCSKR